MKTYNGFKAEMGIIQQQIVDAKKNERANALKQATFFFREFGFTAGMFKGALAKRRGEIRGCY